MATALAPPSTETHYEVHILKHGRWMIEATSMEQKVAMDDAKELVRHSDIRGVKVFKESTNHNNGRSAAISIFNHIKPERSKAVRVARTSRVVQAAAPTEAKPVPVRHPTGRRAAPKSDSNNMVIMIVITALVMLSAAGIYLYTIVNEVQPEPPATSEYIEKAPWLSRPLQ